MDHIRYEQVKGLLENAPIQGNIFRCMKRLISLIGKVEVVIHPLSEVLLKKDIDRWERLFVLWMEGNSTEEDRVEMKVIKNRIDELNKVIISYEKASGDARLLMHNKRGQ